MVCRQRSGAKERSKTVTISVNCYDARIVRLIFVLEQAREPYRKPSYSPQTDLVDVPIGASQKDKQLVPPKFLNFASSPKLGHRILRTVSDKVKGRGAGVLASDLAHANSAVSSVDSMANFLLWIYFSRTL